MKYSLFIAIMLSISVSQQTTSYSWEDGSGTILGSYGNISDPANVGTTSGVSPFDGERMLTVSESPNSGTPQAFIAWVTDLSAGQDITACFYGYDNTPSASPSLRIWGSWTGNDDINSYAGSADGNTSYTDGSGWGQVCHTFSTNQENWDSGEALVVQARLYSSSGVDPSVYFIDMVEVTAPNSATVNYPGGASSGCTDATACNYNPFASEDDGSCIYPTDMSIYDIQYTANQGDYCYESEYSGTCVRTTGTVTAESPQYNNFYIQDLNSSSYSGIYVHNYSSTPPSVGDNITITAIVNEYYSLTQLIDGVSYTINSSGNSATPTDIATGDLVGCQQEGESVESMLVRVNNVVVSTATNEFGEWYVDDGSGPAKIDNKIFDGVEWLEPSTCQQFESITGVVDYAYSEFSIFPRNLNDIVSDSNLPIADAGDDQIVAPASIVTLDGSNSYDPDDLNNDNLQYEWTQLSGDVVALSDEESVITTFTAPNQVGDLVFKLNVYDSDLNIGCDEIIVTIEECTSISDIQNDPEMEQGEYCYETPMVGEEVTLCPAVVTHVTSGSNFFISQPGLSSWGGIFVFDNNYNPQLGDEVEISGTVNEYYSLTQITDVTSYNVISTGNAVVPLSINTGDLGITCSEEGESYEGMLVKVSDIVVENIDDFGNVQINDGTGSTLMDDYYFDGNWNIPSEGETFSSVVGVVSYSYSEFKIYPRNPDDFGSCVEAGDINGDGANNVLDIVQMANCVLQVSCASEPYACAIDLNGDGAYNVLDIVVLANCILLGTDCNGRTDDATNSKLIRDENLVYIDADGFIGGVEMTILHNSDFSIEITDNALFGKYITNDNQTRLLIINPQSKELFNYNGNFEILDILVANSKNKISVEMPLSFSLGMAYPNPFNPTTSMMLTMSSSGDINVEVYNLMGQMIKSLKSGYSTSGIYPLVWDASNQSSGIYIVKAEFDGLSTTQKLLLVK